LVRALPPDLNATFITVSVPIALELLNHPTSEIIFLGNKLLKTAQISIGGEVTSKIKEIRADLCFLGTNSIDVKAGITDLEWEVIEVKKAMIESSQKTVSLAISEKLDSIQRLKVCDISSVDYLITELQPTDARLIPYADNGVTVL